MSSSISKPVALLTALALLGAALLLLSRCGSLDLGRENERLRMVREQIEAPADRRTPVTDPLVLDAMRAVPRHLFVPTHHQPNAYADDALPIAADQTISQPYIVAFMTEALGLEGHEKVLEIGTGSGYQAAVLAEIVDEVYTIEIVKLLAEQATERLSDLGYDNVHVRHGDGYRGWPTQAPFDAIIVTAAPNHVPQALVDQLATGGRLILPEGDWDQQLILITKTEDGLDREDLLPVNFVPMTGEAAIRRP